VYVAIYAYALVKNSLTSHGLIWNIRKPKLKRFISDVSVRANNFAGKPLIISNLISGKNGGESSVEYESDA
jgi:hypothetical protein